MLQSILTGRFDPGGRGPDLAGASPSVLAKTLAGGLATPSGTGTESRALEFELALTSTETGGASAGDATGSRSERPSPPASSPSASSSSSSAILPGGTQLSSVESGRRAVLPQPGSDRPAGRRGPGLRPCARDRAPRYQAVELAPGHRRRGLDRRFRPGQGGRRGADAERRHPGHAPVHVPRAVPWRRRMPGPTSTRWG